MHIYLKILVDALPAAAPPPPPAVDDHDDSYGLDLLFESIYCQWCGEIFPDLDSSTMHIFSAHVDYTREDVTVENFFVVLLGNKIAVNEGSGKVLSEKYVRKVGLRKIGPLLWLTGFEISPNTFVSASIFSTKYASLRLAKVGKPEFQNGIDFLPKIRPDLALVLSILLAILLVDYLLCDSCLSILACRLLLADSCLTTLACRLLLADSCLPTLA
ncbi:hypothetical protein Tco_0742920 [Tanacetum coccineum]